LTSLRCILKCFLPAFHNINLFRLNSHGGLRYKNAKLNFFLFIRCISLGLPGQVGSFSTRQHCTGRLHLPNLPRMHISCRQTGLTRCRRSQKNTVRCELGSAGIRIAALGGSGGAQAALLRCALWSPARTRGRINVFGSALRRSSSS